MYTRRNYGFWLTFNWSKWPFIWGLVFSLLIFICGTHLDIDLSIPWQPIGVIGIAGAFYLGFKNNSSYDRTWEARKIWGSIVNNSRSFGAGVISFVKGENEKEIRKELIYRHIAWMTALRHQLRLSRQWEHTTERIKGIYVPTVCEDFFNKLGHDLKEFLPDTEIAFHESKSNMATQILALQSKRLEELRDEGYFEDFRHLMLHERIVSFYEDQGKSERIKNFPFPRQYASTALWLTLVFCILIPFGMLDVFGNVNGWMAWLSPIFSALIIWIFFLMEKIGDYSENPFEGTYNDVPITTIARGIEIDMREMIDDSNIPGPLSDDKGFQL